MYILFHDNQRLTIDLNERDRVSSASQLFNLILNLTRFYIKDIKNIEFLNRFKFTLLLFAKIEKYVFAKRLLLAVVRWDYGKFNFTIKHCLRSHRLSLRFLFTSRILLSLYDSRDHRNYIQSSCNLEFKTRFDVLRNVKFEQFDIICLFD